MKVEILSGVCIGDGKDVFPGEVVEVLDVLGHSLIQAHQARLHVEPEVPETQVKTRVVKEGKAR
jgi:hypothetical protein